MRSMLVMVHDATPLFLHELTTILNALRPLIGRRMSIAIVTRWHGAPPSDLNLEFRDVVYECDERLIHGWTHQSQPGCHPVSWATNHADEFRGLNAQAIRNRIRFAQEDFAALTGCFAEGLLPPAWQLPISADTLEDLSFVVRFRSVESCLMKTRNQRIATWSWDWGRIGALSRGGELLGRFMQWIDPNAIPCVAIHPVDVTRGYFTYSLQLIERLLNAGYWPTTASQLMETPDPIRCRS